MSGITAFIKETLWSLIYHSALCHVRTQRSCPLTIQASTEDQTYQCLGLEAPNEEIDFCSLQITQFFIVAPPNGSRKRIP